MKKVFLSLVALALVTVSFTSCREEEKTEKEELIEELADLSEVMDGLLENLNLKDSVLKVKEKKVGPLSDGTRYDYFLLKVFFGPTRLLRTVFSGVTSGPLLVLHFKVFSWFLVVGYATIPDQSSANAGGETFYSTYSSGL